jgi:autotransporter family porin
MLPPGASLPTAARCAALVRRSTWEPRPANAEANDTTPPAGLELGTFSQWNGTWNDSYRTRIDGNFTGTTDEIAQWAACKWGWSDNLVRAQMAQESHWRQLTEGDFEPRSSGHCVSGDTRDPCPTSFSIIQVKWYHHPAVATSSAVGSSYPWIRRSTAYALDLQLAEMRGCYDGMSTYLGNTRGDVNGCLESWFTGSWTPGGGAYTARVSSHLDNKPWLHWKG